MPHARALRIPAHEKERLRFLFLAKHAAGGGAPDPTDGNHAVYHHELRQTLEAIGLELQIANRFDALFTRPDVDFVIGLYNRAGFRGSEMLGPLLCEMHDLPCLGGAPMVRGLSDDKHFMKRTARALGLHTAPWEYYPIGGRAPARPSFDAESFVVKPNASSASWGVRRLEDWTGVREHVAQLQRQGHDVIVEAYIDGIDVAVPVLGAGSPWLLPVIEYRSGAGQMRTYEEKRGLVAAATDYVVVDDGDLLASFSRTCAPLLSELWPFDHGRFEFRIERATGRAVFIEINLNCNLWSGKAIATAARHVGLSHLELVETIVCHSLLRQSVIRGAAKVAA